jgi:hypothetical protein
MLEEYLVEECQLITPTYNKYGRRVYSSTETLSCKFRSISSLNRNTNTETTDCEGIFHFAPSNEDKIVLGAILQFEGITYEIDRVIEAKRLGESLIQFIKAEVSRIEIGVS